MTIDHLKLLLLAIVLGVAVFLLTYSRDGGDGPYLSIAGQFERMVADCLDQNPSWERPICERVVRGEVWIGMTGEMLLASVGQPIRVRQLRAEAPTIEEWTYYTHAHGEEIFRLEDDALTKLTAVEGCMSCPDYPPRPVGH